MSTACKFSILIWSMGKWFEIKVFVKADWLQLNTTLFCSWYSQLMFFLNSWIFKHFPEKAFKKMAMMNGAVMGKQAQQPPPPAKPGGIEDLAQVNIFQFRGEYMAQESHLPPSVSESWSSYITFSKDFTQTLHPQYIDSSKSECLNEADDHPYQHCLTRFVCSEHQLDNQWTLSICLYLLLSSGGGHLASDCDEQLILSLSFNQVFSCTLDDGSLSSSWTWSLFVVWLEPLVNELSSY